MSGDERDDQPGKPLVPEIAKVNGGGAANSGEAQGKSFHPGGLTLDDLRVESPVYELPKNEQAGAPARPRPKRRFRRNAGELSQTSQTSNSAAASNDRERPRSRVADAGIFLLLAIVGFSAVALTYRGIGHSWDEALYLAP